MPERERRADRIAAILEQNGGRARTRDVLNELRRREQDDGLTNSSVYVAIQRENEQLEELGRRARFRTSKSGGAWGYVSLESSSAFTPGSEAQRIEAQILEANKRIDDALRDRLRAMDWRTFESTFLSSVLEALGFQDVQITQTTRDGGVDARVAYKRGIVKAKAIVSAKHWAAKSAVPVEEVRNMRGIKGDEDTAIILTTGRFAGPAQKEAEPGQNQRVVYLIDGDRLIEICKVHDLGIKKAALPALFTLDEDFFDFEGNDGDDAEGGSEPGLQRFWDKMFEDLSPAEIASVLGLKESTVRVYLYQPEKRRELGDRIREDAELKRRMLSLVESARARAGKIQSEA